MTSGPLEFELAGNDPRFWAISLGFALLVLILVAMVTRLAPPRAPVWREVVALGLVVGILVVTPGAVRGTLERTFSEPGFRACAHFLKPQRLLPSLLGGILAVTLLVRRNLKRSHGVA